MSDLLVLNVHLTAAPGLEEVLERELSALVAPTLQEPGCVSYVLHKSTETPGKFMFQECFRGQAALDEHLKMPHFTKFQAFCAAQPVNPVASAVVTRWTPIAG